jgi:hypothetical protein
VQNTKCANALCQMRQCAVEQHHDDDDDYEGVSKMVGLVLNGVLLSLVA